jgi:hypothetical protein
MWLARTLSSRWTRSFCFTPATFRQNTSRKRRNIACTKVISLLLISLEHLCGSAETVMICTLRPQLRSRSIRTLRPTLAPNACKSSQSSKSVQPRAVRPMGVQRRQELTYIRQGIPTDVDIRDGMNAIELTLAHLSHLNATYGVSIPLVLIEPFGAGALPVAPDCQPRNVPFTRLQGSRHPLLHADMMCSGARARCTRCERTGRNMRLCPTSTTWAPCELSCHP